MFFLPGIDCIGTQNTNVFSGEQGYMKPSDEIPPGTEDRSRALLEQANALFKEGRFKASEVTFKRVIDRGSNVAEGFYGVGVVRLSLNDQAAAEVNFRRALENNPWHANALYQLGLMAEQREDLEEARGYYRKALATKPEHVGAQKSLARLTDSDSQNAPADTNDYDRQSERLQETMIVELDTPVELVVEDSKIFTAGTRFPINKETTTIGRSSASDIDLVNDDTASRVHAQLTRHGEQLYVEDMGSTNGTYVNGERISSVVPLGLGDELRVGITSLWCVDSDASEDTRIRPAASTDMHSEARPEGIADNQATAEMNDYDRQSERLQETMIVELDTPVELVVEDSKIFTAGTRFPINKETTTIGRSSASDIDLVNDDTASRVHAQLTRHGEQLYVEDMGSTNGTYVNGERISSVVPLGLGDELRVGITSLRRVDSDASEDTRIRPAASTDMHSEARPENIADNQATTNGAANSGFESASTKWGQVALALLLPALLLIITNTSLTTFAYTLYKYIYVFWIVSLLSCGFWAGLAWLGRSFSGYVLLGSAEGLLGYLIDSIFPPPVEANIQGFAAPTLVFLAGALFADLGKKKNLPLSEIPLTEKLAPFVLGLVGLIAATVKYSRVIPT